MSIQTVLALQISVQFEVLLNPSFTYVVVFFFYCTAVTWLRYGSNHYNLKMQAEKVTKFINNIYQFINASLLPSVGYIIHVRCIFPAFFVNNDKTSLNIILHWYNDVLNQIQICDQIHVHPFINQSEIVRFISHRNFFFIKKTRHIFLRLPGVHWFK